MTHWWKEEAVRWNSLVQQDRRLPATRLHGDDNARKERHALDPGRTETVADKGKADACLIEQYGLLLTNGSTRVKRKPCKEASIPVHGSPAIIPTTFPYSQATLGREEHGQCLGENGLSVRAIRGGWYVLGPMLGARDASKIRLL